MYLHVLSLKIYIFKEIFISQFIIIFLSIFYYICRENNIMKLFT